MDRKTIVLMLVTVTALLTAGCMGGGQLYVYQSGDSNPSDVTDTFDVSSGKAQVTVQAGGTGTAVVTIEDANGQQIYSKTFGSSSGGGSQGSQTVSGASGTWTVNIDYTNWQGGFQMTITGA